MSVHRYYKHASSKGDVITCRVKRIRAENVENTISKHLFKLLDDGEYLTEISERIAAIEKESFESVRAIKTQVERDLRSLENEMESAFKLQMNATDGYRDAKFCIDKFESLGTQKKELVKKLAVIKESDAKVISMD